MFAALAYMCLCGIVILAASLVSTEYFGEQKW